MHAQTLELQMRRPVSQIVEQCLEKAKGHNIESAQEKATDGRKGWNAFMRRPKTGASCRDVEVELLRDANGSTGLELIELPQTSQREAEAAAAAAAAEAVADDNAAALEADSNPTLRTSFSKGAAAAASIALNTAAATGRCVAVAGVVRGSAAARCDTALSSLVLLEVNGASVLGCGVGEVVSRFKELDGASSPVLMLRLRKPTVAELGVFKMQQRRQQAAIGSESSVAHKRNGPATNAENTEGNAGMRQGRQITRRHSSRLRSNSWDLNNLEVTHERKKDLQLSSDEEDVRIVSPESNTRRLELKALAEAKMTIACMTFEHEETNRRLKLELKAEKKETENLRAHAATIQREFAEQSVGDVRLQQTNVSDSRHVASAQNSSACRRKASTPD
jgi:hypothetical protein